MKRAAVLLALGACNQVFDLRATELRDASSSSPDAMPDAPPTCPAPGTPLKFGKGFTQVVTLNCTQYIPSRGGLALAMCLDDQYRLGIYEGPADSEMSLARGDLQCDNATKYCDEIRLAPEGSEAFLYTYDMTLGYSLDRFDRGPDGAWNHTAMVTMPMGATDQFYSDAWTQPTRAPGRHLIAYTFGSPPIRELVANDTDDVWTDIGMYELAQLGVNSFGSPRLSEDGLRLVFWGQRIGSSDAQILVSERAAITDRLSPAVPIEGVPMITSAVLGADCDRLYFSALNSVFSQRRIP